jgi:hypothetical protein
MILLTNTVNISNVQLFGFSGGSDTRWSSSRLIWPPNASPKSTLPFGYSPGLGLLLFSGLRLPVGNRVRTACARVASSPSSALSNSGLLSLLSSLLLLPNIDRLLFQKPLLRLPFPSRLHAGGLNLPPESDSAISESLSERKPE